MGGLKLVWPNREEHSTPISLATAVPVGSSSYYTEPQGPAVLTARGTTGPDLRKGLEREREGEDPGPQFCSTPTHLLFCSLSPQRGKKSFTSKPQVTMGQVGWEKEAPGVPKHS